MHRNKTSLNVRQLVQNPNTADNKSGSPKLSHQLKHVRSDLVKI